MAVIRITPPSGKEKIYLMIHPSDQSYPELEKESKDHMIRCVKVLRKHKMLSEEGLKAFSNYSSLKPGDCLQVKHLTDEGNEFFDDIMCHINDDYDATEEYLERLYSDFRAHKDFLEAEDGPWLRIYYSPKENKKFYKQEVDEMITVIKFLKSHNMMSKLGNEEFSNYNKITTGTVLYKRHITDNGNKFMIVAMRYLKQNHFHMPIFIKQCLETAYQEYVNESTDFGIFASVVFLG